MSSALPKKTVASVIERDGGICVLRISPDCTGVGSCADHRANRGHGGAKHRVLDQTSNLIAACGFCNGFKESNADREALILRGVRVESGRTHRHTADKARMIPVEYPNGDRWLLDDEGGRSRVRRGGEHEQVADAAAGDQGRR